MSMTQPASDLPVPPPIAPERTLKPAQWGMASFLLSEVAFFCTLIATYVAFMGKDTVGPTPAQALSLPLVIVTTICLLSSSVVIHFAERSLKRGQQRRFALLLAGTVVARDRVSTGHGRRVAQSDYRSPSHDRPQSVWVRPITRSSASTACM